MQDVERPEHDEEICPTLAVPCFRCHIHGGLTIGLPKDFRTRTRSKTPPRRNQSSYNAGIPVSHRPDGSVMPYLRSDGEVMHQKEFDEKGRHRIKDNLAKLQGATSST